MKTIRIGAGSGFGGDRIEPALELAEHGNLDYLVFECLAERTTALAQQARLADPEAGYDRLLTERMTAVLPRCVDKGIRIISNMGAANPAGAAKAIVRLARSLGLHGLKIAYVLGDDVLEQIRNSDLQFLDRPGRISDLAGSIVSANAYLGIDPMVQALRQGADVVITGRCGDPALFAAPMVHEFGWAYDDWDRLGKATVIGHLLECSGQLTGGYFADPGYKDVANLARLGFPLAEVSGDGSAILSKVAGSGGLLTVQTCKEQLLYEVHDPAAYIQPDVVADFSCVDFSPLRTDEVRVTGGAGHPRTGSLKVTVGYRDGFIGEGQISYASLVRGIALQLALEIVAERLKLIGVETSELRLDIIGVNATRRGIGAREEAEPQDVRARVVGRTTTLRDALQIGREIEAVWINGPAGGGGASSSAREVIAVASVLMPRDLVKPTVHFEVA